MSKNESFHYNAKGGGGVNEIICKQPAVIKQSWKANAVVTKQFVECAGMWNLMTSLVATKQHSWVRECARLTIMKVAPK